MPHATNAPRNALFGLSWADLLRVDLAADLGAIVRPEAIQERIRTADGRLIKAQSRWAWANAAGQERYERIAQDAAAAMRALHDVADKLVQAERQAARERASSLLGLSRDRFGRSDVGRGSEFRDVFPCVPWVGVRVSFITVSKATGRAERVTETISIPEVMPVDDGRADLPTSQPCGRCGATALRHVLQPQGNRARQECAGCGRLVAWIETKADVDRVTNSLPRRAETALATALDAEEARVASQAIAERSASQDAVERAYVDDLRAKRDPAAGINGEIGAGLYFTKKLETVFLADLLTLQDVVVMGNVPYYRLTPRSLAWVVKAGEGIKPGSRDREGYTKAKQGMFQFAEALGITPAMVRQAIASGEAELPTLTPMHKTTVAAPMESGLRGWSWSLERDGDIESVRTGSKTPQVPKSVKPNRGRPSKPGRREHLPGEE